jgi:hypothetical protein
MFELLASRVFKSPSGGKTFHTLAVFDRRIDLNLEENRLIAPLLLCVRQSSSLQLHLVNYAAAAWVADCSGGDGSRVSKTQTTTSQLGQQPFVLLLREAVIKRQGLKFLHLFIGKVGCLCWELLLIIWPTPASERSAQWTRTLAAAN